MADNCEPRLVDNFYGFLKLYSDGSVVRESNTAPPVTISEEDDKLAAYKDVVFDPEVGLWARLYLPPQTKTRLPVLLYFHGSGFCFLSASSPLIHRMCLVWAAKLRAIIVSVSYRLAPEHRLPAAYQDSIAALKWLQGMKREGAETDPWLHSHADFSKIFVMGESAGGNIAHHVGMWAAGKEETQIKGMILECPFFGGEDRTPSEEGALSTFSLQDSDVLWRMALPVGSNRDHPFSNPLADGAEVAISSLPLPPMLFVISGRDILKDRELQYCEVLKKCGKQVEVIVFDDEDHGFNLFKMEEQCSVKLLRHISDFIA